MIVILSPLIGFVAGLRAMTATAAVSRAVYLGWLPLALIEDATVIVAALLLVSALR